MRKLWVDDKTRGGGIWRNERGKRCLSGKNSISLWVRNDCRKKSAITAEADAVLCKNPRSLENRGLCSAPRPKMFYFKSGAFESRSRYFTIFPQLLVPPRLSMHRYCVTLERDEQATDNARISETKLSSNP